CGCRKVDPEIEFHAYEDYDHDFSFRVGNPHDEHSIAINSTKNFDRLIGFENVVVQVGVLKDKDQVINKYLLSAEDNRYVQARLVVALFLSAREVVQLVKRFRATNGLTQESFRGRQR